MIELGDKVKCTITGFQGIVIAKIEYTNGCKRYQVQPQKLEAGKPISEWIDEEQLKVLTPKMAKRVLKKKDKDPGGSGDVPTFSHP